MISRALATLCIAAGAVMGGFLGVAVARVLEIGFTGLVSLAAAIFLLGAS